MRLLWTAALAWLIGVPGVVVAAEVSLESLLDEMVDRDAIARRPAPAYVCKQSSSYDRKQKTPDDPAGWFANADHDQFIRVEKNGGRKEWVIMEHAGPGAIVRFWTPLWNTRVRTLIRFYLDGSDKPAIEANYFDLLRGDLFIKKPFAFAATDETNTKSGVAGDLYLPIPFAKGCKITLDEVPFYYAINYRAYEAGTAVKSFAMEEHRSSREILEKTAKVLNECGNVVNGSSELVGDGEKAMELPAGPAAVRMVQVTVPKDVPAQAMRSIVITMNFDGERTVWCPLGEFFGSGIRLNPVRDWYRTVSADGTLTCRWVMPYEKSGTITLKNLGKDAVKVGLRATLGKWSWDERSMHFHANWHYQHPLATLPRSDWNYIDIQGAGMYAGDTLTVMNPSSAWYGEGDERIYVDGEKFPSHPGTGTEDYYGYAWGMARVFSSPFIAMPRRDAQRRQDWTGYTTTSRVRLLDGVPFTKSLKFDMEVWHWADCQVAYAAGTMWYARPSATCNRGEMPEDAERAIATYELPKPEPKLAGAIECESLQPTATSPGLKVGTQEIPKMKWSGGGQMFVRATKAGDFVELTIPVEDRRPQKVTIYATRSWDYGILRFSLNGKVAIDNWDGYSATSVRSDPIVLGIFEPKDGKIVLRVEVVGSNPLSKPPKMYFGIDCVTLGKP